MHDLHEFETFYAGAYSRIVSEVFAIVGNVQDAEELVQEAFARALVRWSRLRDYDAPEAWVRRVAFNLAATGRQRARRGLAALTRHGPPPPLPPMSVDGLALVQALRRLPLHYRQVLVLHHLVELPVDQIAADLRLPAGTVKTWLARGRAALAAELAEDGQDGVVREVHRVPG